MQFDGHDVVVGVACFEGDVGAAVGVDGCGRSLGREHAGLACAEASRGVDGLSGGRGYGNLRVEECHGQVGEYLAGEVFARDVESELARSAGDAVEAAHLGRRTVAPPACVACNFGRYLGAYYRHT